MTKITLLTAAYNAAKTIRDTLKSIEIQTYPDIEHIIIDGASKDETVAVVRAEGRRVARVVSEPDKGIYDAYNKGIKLASGQIIGFLNSDDFYAHAGVIERVMELFADNPALEAVHADLVYVDQDDPSQVLRWWQSREVTEKSLARGFIPAHPTVFLRRSVYERAGLFDLQYRLAADYEFLLRIFHTHRVSALHVPEIWVRMRAGGATGGAAQGKHDVDYPVWKFLIHKVVDRSLQRIRARGVTLPSLGYER
jgi:glycosyltransferase